MLKKHMMKNFGAMTLGSLLISVGVYFFKIPNGFATGGVTGIATILSPITSISAGVWIWILNVVLLLLGFLFLGLENCFKTIYCSMFYSATTYFFELFIPLQEPLTDQPFLELVYAMLLTAIGAALIFNCNASSGGTDIAALILKKYTFIDVGKSLLAVDLIIAVSSFFVFSTQAGLFSLLGLFTKAFVMNQM